MNAFYTNAACDLRKAFHRALSAFDKYARHTNLRKSQIFENRTGCHSALIQLFRWVSFSFDSIISLGVIQLWFNIARTKIALGVIQL